MKTAAPPTRSEDLAIEWWPLDRIIPYEKNPRKISELAIEKIAASLKEFGWRQPIVVDEQGVIVVGHGRRLAAKRLGMTEAPVHIARGLSAEQLRAYRLADNRANEESRWDLKLLAVELSDLQAASVDLSTTAFSKIELDKLLKRGPGPGVDDVDELPTKPTSRAGDLWLCGPHRVLCGDSTSKDDVARLLAGAKPALMVTDPPYGVELDGEWRDRAGLNQLGKAEKNYMMRRKAERIERRSPGHKNNVISSDTRVDWSDAFALVPSLQVAYVWHASVHTAPVILGLEKIGFTIKQHLVWDKGVAVLMRQHYWYEHEPCWYVRKPNAPWYGKPGENSSVLRAPSPKVIMGGSKEEKLDHPTQKPVDLMRRPILNHLLRGELVYEPFLGSGTTLAAAQITERVCFGMEIDPRFVDIVIRRYNKLAPEAPATLDGRKKKTFDQVAKERAR